MRYKNIILTIILLYGCGLRVTIKLPSIDMSWADEFSQNVQLAEKISKTFNNVITSCENPVKDAEIGAEINKDDFNKCLDAAKTGFEVYLEIVGKKEVKKMLEQVITNIEMEAQNGQRTK